VVEKNVEKIFLSIPFVINYLPMTIKIS